MRAPCVLQCLVRDRYLPPYCAEHVVVRTGEDDEQFRKKSPNKSALYTVHFPVDAGQLVVRVAGGDEMTFADWLLAWDGYTLAAVALEQMTMAVAVTHKHTVAQIAKQAHTEGRCEQLAVIYDRLVRCELDSY